MDGLIVVLVVLGFYFLPTIVASSRNHQSTGGIFVLNLLLGWTFLFWVLSLVWACSHVIEKPRPLREPLSKSVPLFAMMLGIVLGGVLLGALFAVISDYRSQKSTSISTASITAPAYTNAAVVTKDVPETNTRLQFVTPPQTDQAEKIKREAERADFCRAEMKKLENKRAEAAKRQCAPEQAKQKAARSSNAPSK